MKKIWLIGGFVLMVAHNAIALRMLPADRVAQQRVDDLMVENIQRTFTPEELWFISTYASGVDNGLLREWFGLTSDDLRIIRDREDEFPMFRFVRNPTSADVTLSQEQREGRRDRAALWKKKVAQETKVAEQQQAQALEEWNQMMRASSRRQ